MAISTIGASALDSGVAQLGKSLIQNGAMTVAQRGTQTSLGASGIGYTACDRFAVSAGGSPQGEVTASRDTDVPSGAGFGYSLKLDCTTAEAVVDSDDRVDLRQRIEAQNLQHLLYGNAAAKTLSLSFWIKSPKSGTHCVALYQPDGSRSYVREFTVAAADTWEFHSVTFPGDASGTINNDNGAGLHVVWPLVAGTNLHATADAWAAGEDYATSNQQNLLDNTANNFYITGIQLEVGSAATDFEQEDYGTTLAKCQRYYFRHTDASLGARIISGIANSGTAQQFAYQFPVEMRVAPTFGVSNVAHFQVAYDTTAAATTNLVAAVANTKTIRLTSTTASATTAGDAVQLGFNGSGTRWFEFAAEL